MLFSLVTIDNPFERPRAPQHPVGTRPPIAQTLLPALFFTSRRRQISEQAESSNAQIRALQPFVLSCNYKRPFSQAVCFETYTNAWGYTTNFPKMQPLQDGGPRSDQTSGWPAGAACQFHRVRKSCYSRYPASHGARRRDRGERALPQGGAPEVGLSLNEVFVPLNARA
jgi:hypothetical protein